MIKTLDATIFLLHESQELKGASKTDENHLAVLKGSNFSKKILIFRLTSIIIIFASFLRSAD